MKEKELLRKLGEETLYSANGQLRHVAVKCRINGKKG